VGVTIAYRAHFATTPGNERELFIKKDGIVTAYRWIPWLSREEPFAAPNFGERWVTGVSPRVTVALTSDEPVTFATSGARISVNDQTQHFVASHVRDFNFSASPNYDVKHVWASGVRVNVYYHSEPAGLIAKWTATALDRFSTKLGAYPYARLNVAETPAGTGMESPGMTWISATEGRSNLPYLSVHEAAHQWFYGLVGNNQARQPFMDEAGADFLARNLLHAFRSSRCAQDRLDGSVYYYSAKCYNEVIYVQGSNYLNRYRREVGNPAFWRGMRSFVQTHRFRISGTRALLDSLDAASGFDSQRHAARFPSLY